MISICTRLKSMNKKLLKFKGLKKMSYPNWYVVLLRIFLNFTNENLVGIASFFSFRLWVLNFSKLSSSKCSEHSTECSLGWKCFLFTLSVQTCRRVASFGNLWKLTFFSLQEAFLLLLVQPKAAQNFGIFKLKKNKCNLRNNSYKKLAVPMSYIGF